MPPWIFWQLKQKTYFTRKNGLYVAKFGHSHCTRNHFGSSTFVWTLFSYWRNRKKMFYWRNTRWNNGDRYLTFWHLSKVSRILEVIFVFQETTKCSYMILEPTDSLLQVLELVCMWRSEILKIKSSLVKFTVAKANGRLLLTPLANMSFACILIQLNGFLELSW